MDKEKLKAIVITIAAVVMIVSSFVMVGYGIVGIIFAIRNPELTSTQVFLHFMRDTACGKWTIISIINYIILMNA